MNAMSRNRNTLSEAVDVIERFPIKAKPEVDQPTIERRKQLRAAHIRCGQWNQVRSDILAIADQTFASAAEMTVVAQAWLDAAARKRKIEK